MTPTEHELCKMWLQATLGGDWWDMHQQLRAIADVLKTVAQDEAAALFSEASLLAIGRCVYDMQIREAA
jgi:hypothetical protein